MSDDLSHVLAVQSGRFRIGRVVSGIGRCATWCVSLFVLRTYIIEEEKAAGVPMPFWTVRRWWTDQRLPTDRTYDSFDAALEAAKEDLLALDAERRLWLSGLSSRT